MPDWSAANCDANGINIHYVRTGRSKPPVILLHGLIANGACWTFVARDLETEYDVIMPDARGHGTSGKPECGYRYQDHANDVIGLIEVLELDSPVLIGHSMGGMTAAVVASRHPKLIRGLILADPTFLTPDVQQTVYQSDVAEQHRRALHTSFDKLVAEARARHPDRPPELLELLAQARLQTSMNAFDVLVPPNPDYRQLVRAIEVPCLLVFGDTSNVVSPAVAAELQRVNPTFRFEQIQGASHGLHYDQPERFAAVVRTFLHTVF
ncbi:MAG TPA: alpha/beta hydrolase [Gammaproteobacteria bacterium]|nr:alpha/beta hydrolase [Gammaproteobacteria bacterium]